MERTLDGKYRLERALGRGGFGAVYEASDLRLQRRVAAKVMMGSLFGDQAALRRFEREARAAARIDHRNITRVYDYGAVASARCWSYRRHAWKQTPESRHQEKAPLVVERWILRSKSRLACYRRTPGPRIATKISDTTHPAAIQAGLRFSSIRDTE